jgi:adenylosuccinate synthase
MKTAIILVGLGWGDEGKGATTDHICRRLPVDLVVRYSGGSQCGHNVQLADGRRHTFAQFGSGTLAGVPTHLGDQVVIYPEALGREAMHLRELGVDDPYAMLTVDPRCPVTTFYHRQINRLRESLRGDARHGSCGHGIGETRQYQLRYSGDAIAAADLQDGRVLRDKFWLLRERMAATAEALLAASAVEGRAAEAILDIFDRGIARELVVHLEASAARLCIRPMPAAETVVFEGAQGVLLDETHGWHPHTTWSTVTDRHAWRMIDEAGDAARVVTLGVTRAYATRHGDGPLPTYDAELTARLVDPGNPENLWQGRLRVGYLDLPLLRYAAARCTRIDGLAVNHLDQRWRIGTRVAVGYRYAGEWHLRRDPYPPSRAPTLDAQAEANADRWNALVPVYGEHMAEDFLAIFRQESAPVVVRGYGPTHEDRVDDLDSLLASCGG